MLLKEREACQGSCQQASKAKGILGVTNGEKEKERDITTGPFSQHCLKRTGPLTGPGPWVQS